MDGSPSGAVEGSDEVVPARPRWRLAAAVFLTLLALVAMPHQPGAHAAPAPLDLARHATMAQLDDVVAATGKAPLDLPTSLALSCAVLLVALALVRACRQCRALPPAVDPRRVAGPACTRPAVRGPPRARLAEICVLRT